jgi:hypothetical protein
MISICSLGRQMQPTVPRWPVACRVAISGIVVLYSLYSYLFAISALFFLSKMTIKHDTEYSFMYKACDFI